MAAAYIDVRFYFDTEVEDDCTYYDLVSVARLDTNIPEEEMTGIGETLAQSDHWNVGGVGATLSAMVDSDGDHKMIRDYW